MNNFFSSVKRYVGRKQFKYGGYAVIVTLVGIAVVVLINIGLTMLEDNYDLKIDMSQNKKYTLSDQTKTVMSGLTKDVYIYTTYPAGGEDDDALAIIDKIKALSGHITVQNKDPNKEPAFMKPFQQSGETITQGSIIVSDKEGKIFRVLDQYAQYSNTYDESYNVTGQQTKVEGAVTSAINYIQLGYMPTVFLVQGHGELALSGLGSINANLSNQNYNLQTVNIGQTPKKIKAGDLVIFASPKQDISDAERETLRPLMDKGGKFVFLFDPLQTDTTKMPNLMSLLKLFDIEVKPGVIFENDSSYLYDINDPTFLVPQVQSHEITNVITASNLPVVIPYGGALKLPAVAPDSSITITSLLKTSDKSYLKGLDAESSEQTPQDETGPFDIAAAAEKTVGSDKNDSVRLAVVCNTQFATSSNLTDYFPSNLSMLFNSLTWMRNSEKDVYVRPAMDTKSQISITSAAQLIIVIIVSVLLIPVIMLVAGIVIYLRRKHL